MNRPHLLYLAFWFPPSRASGVYRALATTRAFIDRRWDVTVVTATREFLEDEVGSVDDSLLGEIPDRAQVVRVPFTFNEHLHDLDIESLRWWEANFPLLLRRKLANRLGTAPRPGHQLPSDRYAGWIGPVVEKSRELHSGHDFSHVLATGNPYASFEAARLIGSDAQIPYSIDFRDPWSIDVFTGKSGHLDPVTQTTESRIVDGAAACFHVNEAIADAYRTMYPRAAHKQHVVLNGYDPDDLGPVRRRGAGEPLVFGILGTVTRRWPLEPILQAWIEERHRLPVTSRMVLGGHLGYFESSRPILEPMLLDEQHEFTYLGPIPKRDVASFYSGIDVLVVPVPGGAMVTSGKIFEAMAVGVPLILVQAEGGGARNLVADHPLAVTADPETGSIAGAFHQAAELSMQTSAEESMRVRRAMGKYRRDSVTARLVDVISEETLDPVPGR